MDGRVDSFKQMLQQAGLAKESDSGPIYITVPVSIDGQQVGQAAARVILPKLQNNPTDYSEPK